jgi:hypothetical protein
VADEWGLETPRSSDDLYLSRDDEVSDFGTRPAFTGDVYRLASGRIVALVQHPCAMRRGVALAPKLLACEVKVDSSGPPKDWSRGHFKRMYLSDLAGMSYFVDFEEFDAVTRDELEAGTRIAILSGLGVNLLVQRWLHHNSRVIVPTITINLQTSGPFEEADLTQEACDDLLAAGRTIADAMTIVDHWLDEAGGASETSHRDMLADPQQRSSVRASLRRQVRLWSGN